MAKENKTKKVDVQNVAFEIVSLAGDARSLYLECLNSLKETTAKNRAAAMKTVKSKMKEAEDLITDCHIKQTDILQGESQGKKQDFFYLMVHAQDHLMTTILLKELLESFIDLYERVK